ncbi:MAG: flavodoxin family protein [Anaerovoracaceae bacterium]|jgi:multimeric flavodoxin WrbA
MSKIVVITGSPRINGNTNKMAGAFIKAAEAKGHTIDRFDAPFLHLDGCHACQTCFTKGRPCTFDDDFNRIAPYVEAADGIVYVFPVYWYSVPAQIKAFMDKFFSFYVTGRDLAGKKSALISACEENSMETFEGVKFMYEKSVATLKLTNVGEILIPGVFEVGDIDKTDGVAQAAALANLF